jgi:hypothetical protein
LQDTLREVLPYLQTVLGQFAGAAHSLELQSR